MRVQSVTGGRVDFTLCSRVRHWDRLCPSAVKGEGIWWVLSFYCPSLAPPLWIADQVRNDGEEEVGFDLFTLTFDSSPIKGEGIRLVLSFMFGHGQVMVL